VVYLGAYQSMRSNIYMNYSKQIESEPQSLVGTHLGAALHYAEMGWYVHPVHYMKNGKCSCGGRKGCKPAKHPRTKWKDWKTTDENKITQYWKKYPDANIGIATGVESGLLVIDIDPNNGGNDSLKNAIDAYELDAELDTFTVQTGSGGTHYYYQCDRHIKNFAGTTMLGKGVDIRAEGGYVIAPPSNHVSGGLYSIKNNVEPKPLPEKLLALIETQMPENTVINEGSRNNWIAEQAGRFLRENNKTRDLLRYLSELNTFRCAPPLDFSEVETIANNFIANFNATNENVSFKTRWQNAIIDVDLPPLKKPFFVSVCAGLSMYMNTEGGCFPEQETLAERLGMTRQTVSKYLKIAEDMGYLESYKIGRKKSGGFHFGYKSMIPDKTLSC